MKFKSIVLLCLFTFIILGRGTAQENVFLSRDYWKQQPSLEQVKKDILAGNDPTQLNANAFDATVYALLEQSPENVIQYLLSLEGNSIDKKTHDSRIYLHWAAYAGRVDIVTYLLEQGSSVTNLDSHGYTPLTFAANAGQKDKRLYEAFEKNGVILAKEKNEDGANILLLSAHALETEEELNFFLGKGLALQSTDDKGNGIFNYAAKGGNLAFMELLINKGADYQTLNEEGGNAFIFASRGTRGNTNTLEVFQFLERIGLEPNIVSEDGNTPLHALAYRNKDLEIFRYFLKKGVDVNQQDGNGNTPFINAAGGNGPEVVTLLAENVSDFNTANSLGQTALMKAVQGNEAAVVDYLLKKGASVNLKDQDGNTLAYYLINGFRDGDMADFNAKLSLLTEAGLRMDEPQADGNTLWHLAVKRNSMSLLRIVRGMNIPLDLRNDEGLTPLHLAAMKATDTEILQFLLDTGADKSLKTDFDESVYDLALENEILQKQNVSLNFLQ